MLATVAGGLNQRGDVRRSVIALADPRLPTGLLLRAAAGRAVRGEPDDGRRPQADLRWPTADDRLPTFDGRQSKAEDRLPTGDDRALAHLERLLNFFRGFVDRCHHGKEEDVLFPELERRGVPRHGGPVGVMLSEHDVGRGHVPALAEGLARVRRGKQGGASTIVEHARAYRSMLEAHIQKENVVLFPMADRIIPKDVAARLYEQFEELERDRVGEGKHEAYHAMLHDLRDHYGVAHVEQGAEP